jgi:hypothetical protein
MELKSFVALYARHLTIEHLYSINKSTVDYARPVMAEIGGVAQATFNQLEADNQAMGDQMNKASKSVLTANLSAMDEDRDDRFAEIKRNVTMHLLGRDELKKEAAQRLKIFMDPYWDANVMAMNTQTGILNELFRKFDQRQSLIADATATGILDMMTGLETANTEFDALYEERNALEAAADGPSATSLKAAAASSYEQFCTAIEQAVNFTPSETLMTLFNQLDELRKTYAILIHKKENKEEGPVQPT